MPLYLLCSDNDVHDVRYHEEKVPLKKVPLKVFGDSGKDFNCVMINDDDVCEDVYTLLNLAAYERHDNSDLRKNLSQAICGLISLGRKSVSLKKKAKK